MLAAPGYWPRFAAGRGRVRCVKLLAKQGPGLNELTRYRYDVVMHLDELPGPAFSGPRILWGRDASSLQDISLMLRDKNSDNLAVFGIPDGRTVEDRCLLREIAKQYRERPALTFAALRREARAMRKSLSSPTPEDLGRLAAACGMRAEIHVEPRPAGGFLTAVFFPADAAAPCFPLEGPDLCTFREECTSQQRNPPGNLFAACNHQDVALRLTNR